MTKHKPEPIYLADLGDEFATLVVVVTPEFAKEVLQERNKANRSIRAALAQRFAHDVAAGHWQLTGQPIIFDRGGQLIDGQHRLSAAVIAGESFESAVVVGADPAIQVDIDTGARRTLKDVLMWRGEINASELAAALNLSWQFQSGALPLGRPIWPTNSEALAHLAAHPTLRDHLKSARNIQKAIGLRRSGLAVLMQHIGMASVEAGDTDCELFGEFLDGLLTGTNLQAGSGPLLLRNWSMRIATSTTHTRPTTRVYMAMTIKAWNMHVLGESGRSRLSWSPGKAYATVNREAFPVILDPDAMPYEPHDEIKT